MVYPGSEPSGDANRDGPHRTDSAPNPTEDAPDDGVRFHPNCCDSRSSIVGAHYLRPAELGLASVFHYISQALVEPLTGGLNVDHDPCGCKTGLQED